MPACYMHSVETLLSKLSWYTMNLLMCAARCGKESRVCTGQIRILRTYSCLFFFVLSLLRRLFQCCFPPEYLLSIIAAPIRHCQFHIPNKMIFRLRRTRHRGPWSNGVQQTHQAVGCLFLICCFSLVLNSVHWKAWKTKKKKKERR